MSTLCCCHSALRYTMIWLHWFIRTLMEVTPHSAFKYGGLEEEMPGGWYMPCNFKFKVGSWLLGLPFQDPKIPEITSDHIRNKFFEAGILLPYLSFLHLLPNLLWEHQTFQQHSKLFILLPSAQATTCLYVFPIWIIMMTTNPYASLCLESVHVWKFGLHPICKGERPSNTTDPQTLLELQFTAVWSIKVKTCVI